MSKPTITTGRKAKQQEEAQPLISTKRTLRATRSVKYDEKPYDYLF